jgi:succinate dehydrogenase/fumarate reductase-like Fe-S protein
MATCFYHAERNGIGVCMSCRRVICADCSTRLDGVNHCHACIESLSRKEKEPGSQVPELLVHAVALVVSVLLLSALLLLVQGKLGE